MDMFRAAPTGENAPTKDEAFAFSSLTSSILFTQYNPDDLITRKGWDVYKKMMHDEQVKAVVRFHRDAVTGREWSFTDHKSLSDAENERRRDILTAMLDKLPGSFKTKLDMVMSSLYNGFSLVEKTYDLCEIDGITWMGVKSLKLKPFDTFYFNLDDYGNLESLEQQVMSQRKEIPLSKFIHHVQNADVHEYYGQSELREAYRAWWSKDTTLLLQNIWLERSAAGFVWAQPSSGATLTRKSAEYNDLLAVLRNVRSNSAMLIPKNIDFNVVHPNDTQAFERAVQGHDKAIAKALLMPNLLGLSEQGPNGSRALGDTQMEAFLWMLDAEAKNLEETINEQLFADLARYNFPDGLWPRYTLHDLSEKKTMEILDKWQALVNGKAITPTEQDEAHVRQQLRFPVKDDDDEDEKGQVDPSSALTGVQVTSMMEVVDRVANERIPRETGINILVSAFPINRKTVELIMGEVGKGFEPKGQPQPGDDDGELPKVPGEEGDPQEGDPAEDDSLEDETIIGKAGRKRIAAKLAAARKRVDFAVIDAKSTDIAEEHIVALSASITAATIPLIEAIPEDITPDAVQRLAFEGRDVAKIKGTSKAMLTDSWGLGVKHAKDEVSKAAGQVMSVAFARLDEDASTFFDAKSFTMAGKLTADMLAIAQAQLSQGIKESKSRQQIIDSIYEQFAAEGFITPEDAESQMQGILQSKDAATARLSTVVRTNSFEAINEARYSYFTDPELANFVEALEYTAILDSRTTSICQHLDGQVHSAEGEVWNGPWRPPNHFNCRSLLIPVTKFDKWSEDDDPSMMPAKGFGG